MNGAAGSARMIGASGPIDDDIADDAHETNQAYEAVTSTVRSGTLGAGAAPPLPNYPLFEMVPPIRVDDLKPGSVVRLSPQPGHRWHDLSIIRWAGYWDSYEPGAHTESNEVDWGVPVYSGVDGEVIDCWRNSPYAVGYANVSDAQAVGGNFVTIRTAQNRFVYYAHMDTNSIPSNVCPNASPSGWLDTSDRIDCLLGEKCMLTATYLEPEERVQVKAGQYIGRIGAHGNALGAHLHIHVGAVVEDSNGLLNVMDDPHHLVFDQSWFKPRQGATYSTNWLPADDQASQLQLLAVLNSEPVLLWPSAKAPQTASASYRMSDYDGDGDDDLLCHSTETGSVWLDQASSGQLSGTDWSRAGSWCNAATQRLHTGDFNADGRDDLLCHDIESGDLWVDLASAVGAFTGTDFTTGGSWCYAPSQQLLVGDFNGDGRDDLLCHDHATGGLWMDKAASGVIFQGTDWSASGGWCYAHYQRLHVGRLDGDGLEDLLCHDTRAGTLYVDYSQGGSFGGTDVVKGPWCYGGDQRLMIGDVQGSNSDELICFEGDVGKLYVDWAPFNGTDWTNEGNNWCDGPHQRVRLGDVDGNGRDDLLCFDQMSGRRLVDYAGTVTSPQGIFGGTNWSSATDSPWCHDAHQGLH